MSDNNMNMREKIARAIDPGIWDAFEDRARRKEWTPEERAEEYAEVLAKAGRLPTSLAKADAVLAAMREPTEAQIRAVDAAAHEHWPNARKMAVAMVEAIVDAAGKP